MNIHSDVVSPLLNDILRDIMSEPLFADFRLVGGTNIALRSGHRVSTDIDMFSDAEYGSVDFARIEKWLRAKYEYFESTDKSSVIGMGRSYYVGKDKDNAVKLDLMYEHEKFLYKEQYVGWLRMATEEEIAVMKVDAIFRGGRKKDFWDLHHFIVDRGMDLRMLIALHARRFVYQQDYSLMIKMLCDFSRADDEPDPICMLGKFWDTIKLDLLDIVEGL